MKVVFIDLDDTLCVDGKISADTVKTMDDLKNKDVKTVINSGRSNPSAVRMALKGHLGDYVISSNGTEIYDVVNKKVIYNSKIDEKTIKEILAYCNKTKVTLVLNSIGKRFTNNHDYQEEDIIYYDNIDEVLKNYDINQLVLISNNFDRMLVLPRMFQDKYPDIYAVHSSRCLIEEKRIKNRLYYHDFVNCGNSKGSGASFLLDYLHVDVNDAVAIGNGYDDISMLDVVGMPIAVGNAVADLKNKAKIIALEAKDNGVAKVLRELYILDK